MISEKLLNRKAESLIREQLRKQLDKTLVSGTAGQESSDADKLAEQRVEALARLHPAVYSAMTERMKAELAARHRSAMSFRYLSEADPYYYLSLTQTVIATGKLGLRAAHGKFFNPLRHAPTGHSDVINLHPYVGALVYKILKSLRPAITLMQAAGLTPLFLSALAILGYFALWPLLRMRLFSFWLAAQIFFLAPIVIQRSTLGWYDTDPYSIIFPIFIMLTLLGAIQYPRQAIALALSGGFLTGFYPLFWQGWAYILPLVSAGAFLAGVFNAVRLQGRERFALLTYWAVYTVSAMILAAVFLTPEGFLETVQNSLLYSSQVQGGSEQLWPNLLVLVGETGPVTFKKWIYLTSHYGVAALAAVGVVLPMLRKKMNLAWGVVVLTAFPVFVFSFTAERFAILAVFPLSLLAGYGIDGILGWAEDFLAFIRLKSGAGIRLFRVTAALSAALIVMPRLFMGAHVSGLNSHFIMNDTWYGALMELKEKAPKDSIVHSWWPPGYFVNAISGLKTVVDGGSHHLPENFWMAKAFMARDEASSSGLFRMLTAGGNQAMDFLAAKDIAGDQAVSLLLDVVAVDRAKAVKLLPLTWSLRDKAALLGLTHGEGVLAPAYVLIYEDMVTQNLAMQVVDGWSFDRAKEVFSETKIDRETLKSFFERRGASSYMKKMIQVSGKGLPYEPPANVVLRKGSQLTFGNNVMFDLSTGLAFFQGPDGPMAIRSVFKKDGEWAARVPPFGNSAIAAMIIPQEDTFVCVTAHSDLVRSMLFKLTYLKGQGLAHFEPVVSRGSILNRDYVLIYRIHWDD